ncbi:MAG: hypothetical protein J6D53_03610 [Blautia sp.]|nr:hypothetical protein [Blautia sp.]
MKVMSRDFTRTEKILLVLLAVILVGLVYYRFVYVLVNDSVNSSNSEAQALQTEISVAEGRLTHLKSLQSEMDTMEEEGSMSYMPSYNNSKDEIAFLNDVLASTEKYSISFADVTRSGDQIRRSFTLQYETTSYKTAQKILESLCESRDRCLVGDIRCNITETGRTTVNAAATFYETMVGGTPDAGLPADSAAVNN